MRDIKEYFEILGFEPAASIEEVREAYIDLVKVWHPDRFSDDPKLQSKAQAKLKEINEAYQQILDFRNNLNSYQKATEAEEQRHDSQTEETVQSKTQRSESAGSRNDASSSEPPPSNAKSNGTPSGIVDKSYSPPRWIVISFAVIALGLAKDVGGLKAAMLSVAGMALYYVILKAINRTNFTKPRKKIFTWVNIVACWLIAILLALIIKEHHNSIEAGAYYQRGRDFVIATEYSKAFDEFNKAIKLKNDFAEAYSGRACTYISLDKYQQAISDCDKAIKLKPNFAAAYYYRGYAYSSLGNDQQADEDHKIAARLGDKASQDWLTKKGIAW
jgi:tetratricopeptide (TPR) repeat protein